MKDFFTEKKQTATLALVPCSRALSPRDNNKTRACSWHFGVGLTASKLTAHKLYTINGEQTNPRRTSVRHCHPQLDGIFSPNADNNTQSTIMTDIIVVCKSGERECERAGVVLESFSSLSTDSPLFRPSVGQTWREIINKISTQIRTTAARKCGNVAVIQRLWSACCWRRGVGGAGLYSELGAETPTAIYFNLNLLTSMSFLSYSSFAMRRSRRGNPRKGGGPDGRTWLWFCFSTAPNMAKPAVVSGCVCVCVFVLRWRNSMWSIGGTWLLGARDRNLRRKLGKRQNLATVRTNHKSSRTMLLLSTLLGGVLLLSLTSLRTWDIVDPVRRSWWWRWCTKSGCETDGPDGCSATKQFKRTFARPFVVASLCFHDASFFALFIFGRNASFLEISPRAACMIPAGWLLVMGNHKDQA